MVHPSSPVPQFSILVICGIEEKKAREIGFGVSGQMKHTAFLDASRLIEEMNHVSGPVGDMVRHEPSSIETLLACIEFRMKKLATLHFRRLVVVGFLPKDASRKEAATALEKLSRLASNGFMQLSEELLDARCTDKAQIAAASEAFRSLTPNQPVAA